LKESDALKFDVKLRAIAAAAVGFVLLAGCEPHGETIVAEVNQDTIKESEYNNRVQSVTSIPENLNLDAGGMVMVNMIRSLLTDQLAQKYHAVPSDERVTAAVDYQIRMDPVTNAGIASGKLTKEELRLQKKNEQEAVGIGTNGEKPTEQEYDKAYDEYKNKPELNMKASYTVRILQVQDDQSGRKAIAELKKTGDFKGVAEKMLGMPAPDAERESKERTLVAEQLLPELRQVMDTLKVNEITPEPVAIHIANPQQPLNPQVVYAVAQLVGKEPAHVLTKNEARFYLEPIVLQKTHPDWILHFRRELADYTIKSEKHIRIAIPKYAGLAESFVRPIATAEASVHATEGLHATDSGQAP